MTPDLIEAAEDVAWEYQNSSILASRRMQEALESLCRALEGYRAATEYWEASLTEPPCTGLEGG
jgi:hypothetical protein